MASDAFVARKAAVLGDAAHVVRRELTRDGGLLLEVSRLLPDGAPAMVQRFLPADRRVTQVDQWSAPSSGAARRGTWRVGAPGIPADLSGTMRLEPADDGCSYVVEGTAMVNVPLVGGKVEALLAESTKKLSAREADLLLEQLRS